MGDGTRPTEGSGRLPAEPSSDSQLSARALTAEYLLVLGALALIAVGRNWLTIRTIDRQADDAYLVNLSGRQRMLSQRILAFSQRLGPDLAQEEREHARGQLRAAIDSMEASHRVLRNFGARGTPPELPLPLREIYNGQPHNLNERVRRFLREARALADLPASAGPGDRAAPLRGLSASSEELLVSLEAAVAHYQTDGEARVASLKSLQRGMTGGILILLAFTGVFIFRPIVTLRKTAEQALRESEQRFRLLIHSVRDHAIFMHELGGRITVWNEGAERLYGWRADEILGRGVSIFYPPEEIAEGVPERDLKTASVKGSFEREGWRLHKDGSRFWASVTITHIVDQRGQAIGYGRVIRDLTERRKREQELKDSESRLRQSVVELEAFAHTISHDLRSPLRAVEGYSQLLAQRLAGRVDAESQILIQRIAGAAVRLDRLIRDLLSYTAIAQAPIELEAVDLDTTLAYVTSHYSEMAKARLRGRTPLGRVRGQPSLLLQAVSNLLGNAVKFVPKERTPEIDVWTERREKGKVRIVIQDNGIGIPQESLGRIFMPFVRLHPREAYEGTGIGLAIVKRAVERLGGRVEVESTPGQGSRFSIELSEA